MQLGSSRRHTRVTMLLALTLAALLAVALMSIGIHTAQAAPRHAAQHVRHASHARATNSDRTTTAASDTDNVQSGNQTGTDTPSETSSQSESSGQSESSVESEQGQAGEPANGHQDTGANVNNECTGNCVQ